MTTPTVTAIGEGGEYGYLVKADCPRAEAIAHVLASRDGFHESAESLASMAYEYGWHRWNPDPSGEYRSLLADGKAGQRGSFLAVYLRRDP